MDSTRGEINHNCDTSIPGRGILIVQIGRAGGVGAQDTRAYSIRTRELTPFPVMLIGRGTATGDVVYVTTEGRLAVAAFDAGRPALRGAPVILGENVFLNPDGITGLLLSANGTAVYQERQPVRSRPIWVSRQGREHEVDSGEARPIQGNISISRDGGRIAAPVRGDLAVLDLPTGLWTRLTTSGRGATRPAWSPDGSSVAFIAERPSGVRAVFEISGEGGPETLLRQAEPAAIQDAEFSPDGAWLLYRQGPSGPTSRDVYYSRPSPDSAAIPFAATADDEFAPHFSPDGRWVAYVSNETGRDEIFVRPFPGPRRRVPVSTGGGTEPRWAHSGREIFYRAATGALVAATVQPRQDFVVLGRRMLFDASQYLSDRNSTAYDVASDDQRFLFVKPVEGGQVRWVLLRNWREALRQAR